MEQEQEQEQEEKEEKEELKMVGFVWLVRVFKFLLPYFRSRF